MRMKEDHMKNGQFKPGYNLRLGVEGEFIVTAGLFSERSDTLILLPLLEHFQEKTGELPERLVADSGYKSEENYTGLEEMGVEAYIKPVNTIPSMTSTTAFTWGLTNPIFTEAVGTWAQALISGEYTAEEFIQELSNLE